MAPPTNTSVLIIGAGFAGLTAANDLRQSGIDVLVLEAAPQAGGRTESITTKSGLRIDIGGQWIGHDHHRLRVLAQQAGSTVYKTYTKGLPLIIYEGRKLPLYSPAVLIAGVIVLFFDLLTKTWLPKSWNTLSVKDAIANVSPMKGTRILLEALTTLSATIELDMSSIYALGEGIPLAGGLSTMTATEGGAQDSLSVESMGHIIDMLVTQVGGSRVRTSMRIKSINQNRNEGVVVRTESDEVFTAAKVIVTVPPPTLRSISFDPALPSDRITLQETTQMGVVYKAIAVFEKPFWRDHFGGEYIVLDDPPRGILDTSPPTGPGVLVILVGGTPARTLDDLDTKTRRELLLVPLVPFIGYQVLEPLEWHEKAWHLDEFRGGGYQAFPLTGSWEGLLPMPHKPVGNIHWAGTETSQKPGYIEGAIESGQRVAQEVLAALKA